MSSSSDSVVPSFEQHLDDTLDEIEDLEEEFYHVKRRGKGVVYDFFKNLPLEELFSEFDSDSSDRGMIKSFHHDGNFFTYKYKRSSKSGLKFFYSCSPENASCSSSAYLLIKEDTVSIFCDVERTHVPKASRGISKVVIDAIGRFFDVGVTAPKAILRALEKEGYERLPY